LVAIAGAEMCTNQGFKSLVPGPTLHSGYLYHCMRAYSARLAALGNGATFKEVSKSIVEDFEIPLPPLEEQQRIAAILDKADSLRRKRQEAIRLTDDFLRAVFLDIFGDPAANGKGLPVRQLGDVCRFYAGNSLPPGERFDGQPDGVLHIKVGDMNLPGNESDIHVAREWSRTGSGGIIAPEGAILIPKRGGAIATNKKRVLLRPCALDPNLMAIGPGVELRQEVLLEWFKQFDLTSISSGSAVPQLNKGDLAPLKITVPPLALQDKFVQVARKVKSAMAKQSEQLSSIHAVCAALTANLLSA
jgi:type I restriction enzyme S subunit